MFEVHLVVLSLLQGITEFLPISSEAHLILVPQFLGWPDQGLIMDVAVHVGTLGAVVVYFWRDLAAMGGGLLRALKGRRDPGAVLFGYVVLATVPVIAAGYVVNAELGNSLRNLTVIGWATLGFGIVLWLTDKMGMTVRRIEHMGIPDAVIIGCAQVLALIPGTSRSGITMAAARMLGIERPDAARFSMLMSIPAIMGAGTLKTIDLIKLGDPHLTEAAIDAAGLSFLAALLAIFLLMAWLRRATFTPFVIYRIVLGVGLLTIAYT